MGIYWQTFWIVIEIFILAAHLMFLMQIVGDLLRDSSLGGRARALWMVFLIGVPIVAAVIYLVLRGEGMGERRRKAAAAEFKSIGFSSPAYSSAGPSSEIADAFTLLEDGAITQEEYDTLKARIIAA